MSLWQLAQRFYRDYLRRHAIVRVPKVALFYAVWYTRWQIILPLMRSIVPAHVLGQYHRLRSMGLSGVWRRFIATPVRLLSHSQAVAQGLTVEALQVFPASSRPCNSPLMVPREFTSELPALPPVETDFPPVVVHRLKSATVFGRSNLVGVADAVLHHDLADYTHDSTSEELHGRVQIDPVHRTVQWLSSQEVNRHVTHGVAFADAVSANYAHWLTEVLPRMHAFAKACPDSRATALVDVGLHTNLKASIDLVLPATMKRLELFPTERVVVDKLELVSATGYIPFNRRIRGGSGHSHGSFSATALTSMRGHLLAQAGRPMTTWPRRVLLRRSSAARALDNEQALETVLAQHGFASVYPERLSFVEQVQLFSTAEMVVGASGAAMANCIFCPPDARIVICVSLHPAHGYNYWQAIAGAVGNRVNYVLGRIVGSAAPGVHSNFPVKLDHVLQALAL